MNETTEKQYLKVYVRPRPLTKDEVRTNIIQNMTFSEITLKQGSNEKKYTFDRVFNEHTPQLEVYETVVFPLMDYIVAGVNCTVFAYGQSGTGKTYTMLGQEMKFSQHLIEEGSAGLIPRAANHLFARLEKDIKNYSVTISFAEIYNEEVRDLLVNDSTPLRIFDGLDTKSSVMIKGLTEITVVNTNEVFQWIKVGTMERHTASTKLNRCSSRSHTIFTFTVNSKVITRYGEEIIKTGKLHLIDLAGSENIGKSGATDARAREAGTINKSLLTLGKVIKSLAQKMTHVPYRESKLTRILQDSLGGNTKTCMIATFATLPKCWDETLSTLDYASTAKNVANCPKVNITQRKIEILSKLNQEIVRLNEELQEARRGSGFFMCKDRYNDVASQVQNYDGRIRCLMEELQKTEDTKEMIGDKYRALDRSFQINKEYLKSIHSQMQEMENKGKQTLRQIKYLSKVYKERDVQTKSLKNIYTSSAKYQDCYKNKFQNLCTFTLKNAVSGSSIYGTSANSLREIQNFSSNFAEKESKNLVELVETTISVFNDIKIKDQLTKCGKKLASQISISLENLDQILEVNSNIQQHQLSMLQNNFTMEEEKQRQINSCLKGLMTFMKTSNEEMDKDYADCINMTHQSSQRLESIKKLAKQHLEGAIQKKSQLVQKIQTTRDAKNVISKLSDMKINEKDEILQEISKLTALKEKLMALDSQKKLFNYIKAILEKLRNSHPVSLEENLRKVEEIQRLIEDKFKSLKEQNCIDKDNTKQNVFDLLNKYKEHVTHYSNSIREGLGNAVAELQEVRRRSCTAEAEINKNVVHIVEDHLKSFQTFRQDILSFVTQKTVELNDLDKSIVKKANAGNTPIKPVYNFPTIS